MVLAKLCLYMCIVYAGNPCMAEMEKWGALQNTFYKCSIFINKINVFTHLVDSINCCYKEKERKNNWMIFYGKQLSWMKIE